MKTSDSNRLQKSDYESLAAFRYALRRFLRFSEEAAGAAGLPAQHHQALLAIRGFPGKDSVSVGELAERLQIRHHSAVGLIDRLMANGLVSREADPTDGRKVFVRLTGHGEAMLAELSSAHREELRRTGPQLLALLRTLVEEQE